MLFDKKKPSMCFGMDGSGIDEHLITLPFLFRHIKPASKILDIGCTGSPASMLLSILRYNVTGIDYIDYPKQHPNMKFIKGNFNGHDFGKERYDIVLSMNAVCHFGLQYYDKSEPKDMQADVVAMTKVKELINKGGQLIFTCMYGIQEIVTESGKAFSRVYDDRLLDVLLSTFEVQNTEYYMITDRKNIRQVPREEAMQSRHYRNSGTYAIACINAFKQ